MFSSIKIKKLSDFEGQIIVSHGEFFEKLGSYRRSANSMNVEYVFINIDRLVYWLKRGSNCELAVYKLIKNYKYIDPYKLKSN